MEDSITSQMASLWSDCLVHVKIKHVGIHVLFNELNIAQFHKDYSCTNNLSFSLLPLSLFLSQK